MKGVDVRENPCFDPGVGKYAVLDDVGTHARNFTALFALTDSAISAERMLHRL